MPGRTAAGATNVALVAVAVYAGAHAGSMGLLGVFITIGLLFAAFIIAVDSWANGRDDGQDR
jgi:hypothetical protein